MQMSSSETIIELRQARDKMKADVDSCRMECELRQKKVKGLETRLLNLEEGEKGILIRLARFMKATKEMGALQVCPCLNRQIQSLTLSR